jgi:hypothetical protein
VNNDVVIALVVIGIPSVLMAVCWVTLMVIMRETIGELKLFLQPNNLVKLFALYLVISGTTLLSILKIIDGGTAAAIFSGIVGYTIGAKFSSS